MKPLTPSAEATLGAAVGLAPVLRHVVVEDTVVNLFLRQGPVAAHALWTSGHTPRLLIAFAAGNSGAGVWFEPSSRFVTWQRHGDLMAESARDEQGRVLHGVRAELEANVDRLVVRQSALGSIRVIRDFEHMGRLPAGVPAAPQVQGASVVWARDRLDGAPGYRLRIEVSNGRIDRDEQGHVVLAAHEGAHLRLRLTALTGEEPLTGLLPEEILRDPQGGALAARQSLAFLSYREKFLAGSWRFLTYFGRDTLMSVQLLMPALLPEAIEAALGSVLDRLSPEGDVAHEEDIGEFAVLRHRAEGRGLRADTLLDYKMVDDDFMLAPVAASYLLGSPQGPARAAAFLARTSSAGITYAELLARNLRLVLDKARAFAVQPSVEHLVPLKPGEDVGDWRDSREGLGGGLYSYSVNAVLVPAALRAVASMSRGQFLPGVAGEDASTPLRHAESYARVWERRAPEYFRVHVPSRAARAHVQAYAQALGVDASAALASLPLRRVGFSALSLDRAGRPLPILHSDFGFAMLFQLPDAKTLEREVAAWMRPFPAGLMSGAGLLVANAVHAGPALQETFGPERYHGAVVWSWQQALMAAGLARQLARCDLPRSTRTLLTQAQTSLWRLIEATGPVANGELWSWVFEHGRYHVRQFGPLTESVDEANAAQLWSTVYLAVKPPGVS